MIKTYKILEADGGIIDSAIEEITNDLGDYLTIFKNDSGVAFIRPKYGTSSYVKYWMGIKDVNGRDSHHIQLYNSNNELVGNDTDTNMSTYNWYDRYLTVITHKFGISFGWSTEGGIPVDSPRQPIATWVTDRNKKKYCIYSLWGVITGSVRHHKIEDSTGTIREFFKETTNNRTLRTTFKAADTFVQASRLYIDGMGFLDGVLTTAVSPSITDRDTSTIISIDGTPYRMLRLDSCNNENNNTELICATVPKFLFEVPLDEEEEDE